LERVTETSLLNILYLTSCYIRYIRIIKAGKKGKHLNTLEKKYYIHRASKNNLQLNDTNIDHNNPIFDTLHEIYTGPPPTSTAHTKTNRDGTTTQPKINRTY
jgi:hypothetical protein